MKPKEELRTAIKAFMAARDRLAEIEAASEKPAVGEDRTIDGEPDDDVDDMIDEAELEDLEEALSNAESHLYPLMDGKAFETASKGSKRLLVPQDGKVTVVQGPWDTIW